MRVRRPLSRTAVTLLLPATAAAVVAPVLLGTSAPAQVLRAEASSTGTARGADSFGIRVGSVTGLRPGGDVTVTVRYTNPFRHDLLVTSQQIEVASPSPACSASYVDLGAARKLLAASLVVPAGGAKAVGLAVIMRSSAPDGCQGVRFTTTVRAQGRKA